MTMNRTPLPIGNWAKGFRVVAACITGMFVAFILLVAIEFFSSIVHPVPPDFGGTKDEMCQHVARYPHWVLTLVVPLWGITAFVSTWTAERIGGRGAALFIGLLLVAAVVFNVWELPYPIWFKVMSVIVIPVAVALGSRMHLLGKTSGSKDVR